MPENLNITNKKILVIGAGLSGSEAAWYLANHGVQVILAETKTIKRNPAQTMDHFAELVCTNSLKANNIDSAHGILKSEMKAFGSIIVEAAEKHAVPAGMALAVNREDFSSEVTSMLKAHPLIEIIEVDVSNPIELQEKHGAEYTIIASGPLTTDPLQKWITENISGDDFYFYDAIAPVVDADSLNFSKLYYKDRHTPVSEEEGVEADYLNAPLDKEEYLTFVKELQDAEKVPPQGFENYKFFESCLPVDTMAERGIDTPRFSCMKPIGLELPDGTRPYAAVQLRRENLLGSAFNLVGFQTKLTYGEQKRVFRMIPGLEDAEFIHLGSIHRNSFLNTKKLCNQDFSSISFPSLYFAGQISGVEGYTESASMGIYVAIQLLRKMKGEELLRFPVETGMGALVNYIFTAPKPSPSNINFGLLPSVVLTKEERRNRVLRKKIKKKKAADRAVKIFDEFRSTLGE
ncbi:MAG: methylenetetrahydrofolate--tRNA-(uracil(54)-C(5))-methyltransferase (FADH(2)-oxidizing) TrmFO [Bacteriovoracaceae bacterium]|nr:methylenetetrahydrofolate--tRNA-(uracil(54)-C(5))-methyltransferase (FADH(2)-oxidizing) TrmFO [Bacteriovoracaceae bacterium]